MRWMENLLNWEARTKLLGISEFVRSQTAPIATLSEEAWARNTPRLAHTQHTVFTVTTQTGYQGRRLICCKWGAITPAGVNVAD
jgi:hypothetical protein